MPQVKTKTEDAPVKESIITEEMRQAAAASVEVVNEQIKTAPDTRDFSKPRTRAGGSSRDVVQASSVPVPEGLDPDNFGPTAFAAIPVGRITGSMDTQEFTLDAAKVDFLHFQAPGQNLPKKRLYTIKALKPNGELVQLPFEPQIQNNAGGDPEDAIGLRRYARKGYLLLMDMISMQPVYCAAWGCWARADGRTGFCSDKHAKHTLPNKYKDAGAIVGGLMDQGVTTSRTWSV